MARKSLSRPTRADEEKSYLGTRPDEFSTRVVWAGEGVDLVRDAPSAAEVIERIVAEAASVLTRGAALVRQHDLLKQCRHDNHLREAVPPPIENPGRNMNRSTHRGFSHGSSGFPH